MKKIFIILLLMTNAIFVYSQLDSIFATFYIKPPLPSFFDNVTKYTPANKDFTAGVLKSGYELTSTLKQAAQAYCDSFYNNNLTLLGEATNTYNCHGYVWHMVENEIRFEEEYDTLWSDYDVAFWLSNPKSYEEVSWRENAKIRFQNLSDHSAIATNNPNIIISKWGNLPLFRHNINDCPYASDLGLKYYWIKKPVISDPPESLNTGQQHTFSETRFVANNILGIEYNWEILNNNLTQVGANYTSEFTVEATSYVGKDTLCLHITTPSGQTNSDTIEINLNPPPCPDPDDFTVYIEERYGDPVPGSPDGPFEVCDNTSYWICLYPFFLFDDYGINDVDFDFDFDYEVEDEGDDYIVITIDDIYEESTGEIYVNSECGGYHTLKSLYFVEGTCGYYLMLTPNPSNNETTVSIEPASTKNDIKPNLEWELEVYSESQLLKEKKTNLKGKSTKIQTQGWKEGVYIVRARYDDKILQGKLMVNR